jgi:hypothetical protein
MSYTDKYLHFLTEARPSFIKQLPRSQKDEGVYDTLKTAIKKSTSGDVSYTSEGLIECDYASLERALDILDNMPTKRKMGYSSIIYGEAGIGKSAVVEARARKMAANLGRKYVSMDEFINEFDTIDKVTKNLKNYYIFMDIRVASMDPAMMTGIPDPTSPERKGYLTEMPLPWVALMTLSSDAAGFLFLDELNMAGEEVQKGLYSLLNFEERRIAGQYLIKGDWRIHSAGNWGEGYDSNNFRLALKERLAPYLLKIDFNGWSKWANSTTNEEGNPIIHPLLMDFIEEDPEANFYVRPSEEYDPTKRPNPRNLTALSAAIYTALGSSADPDKVSGFAWNNIITQASSICGKEFGENFKQFLISNAIVNIEDVFDDPSSLVTKKGAVESEVTQKVSVFKRKFKQFVSTFSSSYSKAKDEAVKTNTVDLALNYLYVLDEVFKLDAATAANMFTPVVTPKLRGSFATFRADLVEHLINTNEKQGAKYVNDLIKKLVEEVGGNVAAFTGAGGPTSFVMTGEENEEGEVQVEPKVAGAIEDILTDFEQRLQTGNLIKFV